MWKNEVCLNILVEILHIELLPCEVSIRIKNFYFIWKLVLGLVATTERSFELLSTSAINDLFFELSNLFLEFKKIVWDVLLKSSFEFNHSHQLAEASVQSVEDFFKVWCYLEQNSNFAHLERSHKLWHRYLLFKDS
jgi:hypothetical protein